MNIFSKAVINTNLRCYELFNIGNLLINECKQLLFGTLLLLNYSLGIKYTKNCEIDQELTRIFYIRLLERAVYFISMETPRIKYF